MLFFDPHRIPLAVTAVVISCVLGIAFRGVIRNANPLLWQILSKLLGAIGDRMDKTHRPRGDLVFRGFLVTIAAIILGTLLAKAALLLINAFPLYGVTEVLALATTLSTGAIWALLLDLFKITSDKKKGAGEWIYYTLAHSSRYNLATADTHTISRAAIGYAAQNFCRALVLPLCFYILFGIQGAILAATIAATAWRFGKAGFSKGTGALSLALEWLVAIIPSIVSGVLLAIAAIFTPKTKNIPHIAFPPLAQGGLPLAIMAGSLKISLGGAFQDMSGGAIKGAWVGAKNATAKNEPAHLRRAVYQLFIAHILLILLLCVLYLVNTAFSLSFILDFTS